METNINEGKIFALCGIDGCGKSTLVEKLIAKLQEHKVVAEKVKKQRRLNVDLVQKYWSGEMDWSKGEFAKLVSIASAFDFLVHYEYEILPRHRSGNIIICDRYSYCYAAYMDSVKANLNSSLLFANVVQPTKTFHVHVSPEVAVMRHHSRGGPSPDETPEVMKNFSDSYEKILIESNNVIKVDNTNNIEKSVDKILGEILNCL